MGDWLGSGAYFWENNPARAFSWAEFLASSAYRGSHKVKCPAVVGAIIDPGNCLDLTAESSLRFVRAAYESFKRSCQEMNVSLPVNEPADANDEDFVKRYLDCAVINFLHEMREEEELGLFDTVRSPFLEGGALYHGAKISARTHVQWCVREPKKSIIGYFRPRNMG